MIRNITLIIFSCISTLIYSQKTFDYNFYLNGTIGFGIPISNTEGGYNNTELNYEGIFLDKGAAFIHLKNNLGLHLNIISMAYDYKISTSSLQTENVNFYIWDKENYFWNVKTSLFVGLSYKINYKRLVVTPYFDLGFIPEAKSYIQSIFLKEHESNNIREIRNSTKIQYDKFDYTFGADFYFHFGKNWGLATTIQYDRFSASTDFTTTTKDYYSVESTQNDNIKFDNKNILVSFGLFISFFDNNKTHK